MREKAWVLRFQPIDVSFQIISDGPVGVISDKNSYFAIDLPSINTAGILVERLRGKSRRQKIVCLESIVTCQGFNLNELVDCCNRT